MPFENDYFNETPLPVRLVFPLEPVRRSALRSDRWVKARSKTFSHGKYVGTDGEIWIGETKIGRGQIDEEARLILSGGGDGRSAEVMEMDLRIVAHFGRAFVPENAPPLAPGDVLALDHPAADPVSLRFDGCMDGWAQGEFVLIDDEVGVRITSMQKRESVRRNNEWDGDASGVWAVVTAGSFVAEVSALDSIGEGTIVPLGHAITAPFGLQQGGRIIAEGRIRTVLPGEALYGTGFVGVTGSDPANPRVGFVVTQVADGAGRRHPRVGFVVTQVADGAGRGSLLERKATDAVERSDGEERTTAAEPDASLGAILEAVPDTLIWNALTTDEPLVAGVVLQVLGSVEVETAAALLQRLFAEERSDVVISFAIANGERVYPEIRRRIAQRFWRYLSDDERNRARLIEEMRQKRHARSGIECVSNVLAALPESVVGAVLEAVGDEFPEHAQAIRERLTLFDDIAALNDSSIQKILREIDTVELVAALSGASERTEEAIRRNMSRRGAAILDDEIRYAGTVPEKKARVARERIVAVVRRLIDQGDIE